MGAELSNGARRPAIGFHYIYMGKLGRVSIKPDAWVRKAVLCYASEIFEAM